MSLPVRERGLKYRLFAVNRMERDVAPCAGAWVEIPMEKTAGILTPVAPCAGAWVEIGKTLAGVLSIASLPVRERGLKFIGVILLGYQLLVAPCAGAWVEIFGQHGGWKIHGRRSLCGSVG